MREIEILKKQAIEIRKRILEMVTKAKSSHVGGALSCADILTALYFNILSIDPKNPSDSNRDRFILSKGHSCSALYAALAQRGFFARGKLDEFCSNKGHLWGHSSLSSAPGVDATTGSLGHGLSIGVGMAIEAKLNNRKKRVFVLLGDGECDEGSVWEAALSANHFKLDNLIAIIDYNKIQSFGFIKEVLDLEPFMDKWLSFGWSAKEIDGHNMEHLVETLSSVPFEKNKPNLIIAHTIKGKGVSFMEGRLEWHYKSPNQEQFKIAIEEVEKAK